MSAEWQTDYWREEIACLRARASGMSAKDAAKASGKPQYLVTPLSYAAFKELHAQAQNGEKWDEARDVRACLAIEELVNCMSRSAQRVLCGKYADRLEAELQDKQRAEAA